MRSLTKPVTDWLQTDAGGNCLTVLVIALIASALIYLWMSPVWGERVRRVARHRAAVAALVILSIYATFAVMDSIHWQAGPHAPSQSILERCFAGVPQERTYSAPLSAYEIGERNLKHLKGKHLLGTDSLGRDVLLRTLKGCRTALIVGSFTLLLALPVAIVLGISAGYFGGIVDDSVQYLYVTLSSIPSILLLITLMMVIGQGLPQICIALAVTEWVGLARYLRGETLKHREKEYVMAARALGVHPLKILQRHIFPNVFHLVIISATLSFSGLVLSETILSYLGVGVPPTIGSWGLMIDGARNELAREPMIWWNLASASTALFILVLAANVLGDAVRDAFDPRLREG